MLCVGSSRASAAFWKRGLYLATLEYLVKDDVVMGRTSSGLDGSLCFRKKSQFRASVTPRSTTVPSAYIASQKVRTWIVDWWFDCV